MPLLDHFQPPLSQRRHWEGLHTQWAGCLAAALNQEWLPAHLFAEPQVTVGGVVQVDVATLEEQAGAVAAGNGNIATACPRVWAAPVPTSVMPATFVETFEVQVIDTEAGPRLVAAIELVSPRNKDRPEARQAFALKCASYLAQGISLIIMDVVTSRLANLHNQTMSLLEGAAASLLGADDALYAAAYRPVRREHKEEIDIWTATFEIGDALPTLPLALAPDLTIPVDFEASYREGCSRLRIVS